MKRTIISSGIALFICCSTGLSAQTRQKLNIEQATVFIKRAELTSTAKVLLNKGENEMLFSNVAGNVNNQSIVVNATNGVVVQSVTFQNNYLATDNVSPKAKAIQDSIDAITARQQLVATKIAVLTEQESLFKENHKIAGDNNGLSVTELQKMLDLVNTRLATILNQKDKQSALHEKMDERIAQLNQQLEEEQKRDYQPGGQLLVKFYAKENTASNIMISYVVPNAGWTPMYDIWVDDVHSPVKYYYKANIYQNSGVKWNNVRLTLSTGNPQEGMQAPELSPWFLALNEPVPARANMINTSRTLNEVTVQYKKPLINKYTPAKIEDVTTISPPIYQASMNEYVAVDNAGVNTTFDIDIPYSIPSDGQQHLIAVKKYETPATFEYFSAPKMDKDAFLLAKIAGWEELNLLPGQTNIFYEGTYVGQGYIDTRNIKDTMSISLGRDKKIVVKKEQDKKLRSVKMIGTNVRETFAYNITVRNTRKEAVTIVLNDQMPVSNDADLQVEDIEMGGAVYDETTGLMIWTLTLAPNQTKKLQFGYTLKYPKGKTIANLR